MNFFYPLPNQGTLASGYGVFQQFVPETRKRHRADVRVDHEASKNDSLFLRGSYQHYTIRTRSPSKAGNALTNLPILNRDLDTGSVVGGWTRIFIADDGQRVARRLQLRQLAARRARSARRTSRRSSASRTRRACRPIGSASRRSVLQPAPNRPTNIADAGRNVDRTLRQNAFSLSDNLTWIKGGHSLKAGGLWTRNIARDGFGFGVNYRGQYRFNGRAAPATRSPTSCSACRSTRAIRSPTAGRSTATRTTSRVRAGRLEDQQEPDGVPRPALRDRRRVAREEPDCSRTSARPTAATTSCRTRRSRPCCRPG